MTNAYIVNLRNLSIVADSEEEAKEKMLENIKEAIEDSDEESLYEFMEVNKITL